MGYPEDQDEFEGMSEDEILAINAAQQRSAILCMDGIDIYEEDALKRLQKLGPVKIVNSKGD